MITFTLNGETFAQESQPDSALSIQPSPATTASENNGQADSPAQSNPDQSPSSAQNADNEAADSDNNEASADDNAEDTVDPMEILAAIRNSFAEKEGLDNLHDDLILSQSSSYIFLIRRKVRDVTENILDHWYLSSFEENLNLTSIEFDFIVIPPTHINLDFDTASRLSAANNEFSLLNNLDISLILSAYLNYPIPDSVMKILKESSEETDADSNSKESLYKSFIMSDYVILSLALLGFSILGYVIYKLVVWIFMLDQTESYEPETEKDNKVVAPIDMNVYSSYFYQNTQDNNDK